MRTFAYVLKNLGDWAEIASTCSRDADFRWEAEQSLAIEDVVSPCLTEDADLDVLTKNIRHQLEQSELSWNAMLSRFNPKE